jgi:hypothetical protein
VVTPTTISGGGKKRTELVAALFSLTPADKRIALTPCSDNIIAKFTAARLATRLHTCNKPRRKQVYFPCHGWPFYKSCADGGRTNDRAERRRGRRNPK